MARALEQLERRRDRVLDGADVALGDTIADVGAGTGLLALGAVERVGADGDVLAIDISVDALEQLRTHTAAPNISYLVGSADVLPLPDESVDAVVTRSVLIYVADKREAAREFARVLRRGGCVSMFEPINSRNLQLTDAVDCSELGELAERVRALNTQLYANPDDPMLNFDESDLVALFEDAGFAVELELGVDEGEVPGERYLNQVGAPGRPTVRERWAAAFGTDELERLVTFVESRTIPWRVTHAFLTGRKA